MLRPSANAAGGDWVIAAMRDFDGTVGSVVPAAFDAYARVFHPPSLGRGDGEAELRWADVARANARVMHGAAEWGSLTGSWNCGDQPGVWDSPPAIGMLPGAVAAVLAGVLADYTDRPSECCFAVWDGWGTPHLMFGFASGTSEAVQRLVREAAEAEVAAWQELIASASTFELPQRSMRLLAGEIGAIMELYEPHRSPPSLWWSGDQAWCVGTDIDLMTTYVGGSSVCIDALLAHERLEALAVPVDQCVTWEADTVNPPPAPP